MIKMEKKKKKPILLYFQMWDMKLKTKAKNHIWQHTNIFSLIWITISIKDDFVSPKFWNSSLRQF